VDCWQLRYGEMDCASTDVEITASDIQSMAGVVYKLSLSNVLPSLAGDS
jgi:hypothetical protein